MKQWFTAAAVALGIGSALTGWAQGPGNHIGLKLGATRTALDGVYNLKSDYKTGYSGGLVLRCRISKPVAIQPELLVAQYGAHNQYVFGLVNPDPEYNTNLTYLVLQNGRAPFQTREARLAVAAAIDRPLLVRTSLGGRARVAATLLPPESWTAPSGAVPMHARPVAIPSQSGTS